MIKRVVSSILIVMILIAIFFQIKAEAYINSHEKACCILNGKARVSYKPIAVYYTEIALFDADFAKDEVLASVLSILSNCPESCQGSIGGWEQYFIASYYTNEEKIGLIRRYVPKSLLLN